MAVEDAEEEVEYGLGESALALVYKDDAEPDVYIGMDVELANAPLMPMPTAVPPPPLRSCEQRHCRFHAAEDVHQHRRAARGGAAWERPGALRDLASGKVPPAEERGSRAPGW